MSYDAWKLRSSDDERARFDSRPAPLELLELPPLCEPCPICEGAKSIHDEGGRYRCPACEGHGYVRAEGDAIEEEEAHANG